LRLCFLWLGDINTWQPDLTATARISFLSCGSEQCWASRANPAALGPWPPAPQMPCQAPTARPARTGR